MPPLDYSWVKEDVDWIQQEKWEVPVQWLSPLPGLPYIQDSSDVFLSPPGAMVCSEYGGCLPVPRASGCLVAW